MKICEKCGAHNSDDKMFCVDCNEKLGNKLSASQERKIREEVSGQIDAMYNKKDPLYVSSFDKIIGAISAVGLMTTLVLMLLSGLTHQDIKILLCAGIFLLVAVIEALVPQVSWTLEKVRLSFTVLAADDLEPSDFYLKGRKIGIVCAVAFGIIMLVASFL